MTANSEARKRSIQRAMEISSAALASREAHEDYFERLVEEHDAKTDKILLLGLPPTESIQYLLDVFIEGGYAENELDVHHISKIHEWLKEVN